MTPLRLLDVFRKRQLERAVYGAEGDDGCGVFMVPSIHRERGMLRVVASDGDGWDHVSVSREDRTPTWEEMEQIFRLFFQSTETAFQLHVPAPDHINAHPYCLHLWRPHDVAIPRPDADMVGPAGVTLVEGSVR